MFRALNFYDITEMATEQDVAAMAAAMQTMNAQIIGLTQQVQQLQHQSKPTGRDGDTHNKTFFIGRDFKPEKFAGNDYHSWNDDVKAILGTKQANIPKALRWAEKHWEHPIEVNDVELETEMEAEENEALHAYLMVNTHGEPRTIIKGSLGNGLEAWRRLKNRYDPETEMNQIGATIRALNPPKVLNIGELLPAIERWEDELRRQEDVAGAPALNEPAKKAIVTEMVPEELGNHLRLNASKYQSYDQMRWQVVNYVNLKLPTKPIPMQVGAVDCGRRRTHGRTSGMRKLTM